MANHEQSHFGAESIMGLAKERLLGLGQKIAIRSPSTEPPFHGRVLAGTLVGLDSTGALLIEKDGCVYAAWSGSLFFCL
jgi:biotin-(acetyl-CoA carboxylase) ligase